MPDIFSPEKRSDVMRQIHSEDTSPEIRVRKFLFQRGFRYRLHTNSLPGKPDIVLRKQKTVILVQGCFWHGHACKIGSGNRKPKQNRQYWNRKIEKNINRDKENETKLLDLGWKVIKVWECKSTSEESLSKVLESLIEKRING
jgi:DNA mismatch endonuclease, patch repair protein